MTSGYCSGGLTTIIAALTLSACAASTPPAEAPPAAPPPAAEPEAKAAPAPVEAEPLAPVTETAEDYYVNGVAGGVMTSTLQLEAVVISVDQQKRQAVLRGPKGNEVLVRVGKDAVNFYQVAEGDRVNVTAERELVIYVPDATEKAEPDGTTVAATTAAQGGTPEGSLVATTKVTSTLTAMDKKARTATLTFEDGRKETFQVRPDVDMTKYKVGQKVVFLLTEFLALDVKKL